MIYNDDDDGMTYDNEEPQLPEGADPNAYERIDFPVITKRVIEADRRRMASYIARFDESWWQDYFVETQHDAWTEYSLAPVITEWLTTNATDYILDELDRGDWGEGTPVCTIDFAVEAECDAFIEKFQHIVHGFIEKRS